MDGTAKRAVEQIAAYARQEGSPSEGRMHDAKVIDPEDRPRTLRRAVVKLTLLLPQQLESLENAATRHEMTVWKSFLRLIRVDLAGLDDARTPRVPTLPGAEADASNTGFVWSKVAGRCAPAESEPHSVEVGDTMAHTDDKTSETETLLETYIQARLGARVRNVRVECRNNGVILQGSTHIYYAKQLAQHSVMEITDLTILANEIEVT